MEEINKTVNDSDTGLCIRHTTVQTQADQNTEAIAQFKWENNILKGTVQKQSHQICNLNDKVLQLTARSMENNSGERHIRRHKI